MNYHITRTVGLSYEATLEKVTAELKKEGFGVLTEIDVKATLKNKLDLDFRRYMILGACNPQFAQRALSLEDKIGVLLPCNVVVQEREDGSVEVSAMDPGLMLQVIDKPALHDIALEVQKRMKKIIDSV